MTDIFASRIASPLFVVLTAGALIALTGCASSKTTAPPARSTAPLTAEADRTEQALRQHTRDWEGTPYRLGGTNRSGIDCSGFVARMYRDVLRERLPRTTENQARMGRFVSPKALQPGDLVFFRPANKQRHVGIYLRDGSFAHASVSQGVTISELDAPYWQRAFWMARRVLPDFHASDRPSDSGSKTAPTRTGW